MGGEADPADHLYTLAPEEFIAARQALARSLRTAGDREQAAEVAKLRRPSTTAWALNQVARAEPGLVGAVLAAGSRLRSAMDAAVAGDASLLRPAQRDERAAVDTVVAAALDLMQAQGHSPSDAVARRLEGSLRAAVLDHEAAVRLERGVLDRDLEASGFGLEGLSASPAPAGAKGGRPRGDAAAERERSARRLQRERDVTRLRAHADQLLQAAARAEGKAVAARAEAEAAESAWADATRRLEQE
ncbi:MAG TPA: hypothetical protein VGI06_09580 [Acidimicrobiales bacterium]